MSDEQHHDEDVVEPDAVEEPAAPDTARTSRALEPVAAAPAVPSVTPQVTAMELGERLELIEEVMREKMEKGVDYGVIPGTDKPALFKPGAEKLAVLFRLDVQPRSTKTWEGEHLTVENAATVYDIATGARIGYGEGLCTTREKKYARRYGGLSCPTCAKETVKRSKKEAEFYCWAKIGGCGETFALEDERITSQKPGEIPNPDLPDMWNTVIKMAEKRARVDAVLAVTGASAIFTQDIEDRAESEETVAAPGLPAATEEELGALRAGLEYILPTAEAKRVWEEIRTAFGGNLYGPATVAALAPIRALKSIHDDEAETEAETKRDEEAQAEAGESAEEKREREAREKAGKKRTSKGKKS
jgi:hypothetical protein